MMMTPQALTRWQRRWQWITDFPTTNGMLITVMLLLIIVTLTTLTMMVTHHKDDIDITVLGMLLAGLGVNGGVGSIQKIKKWDAFPASSADERGTDDSGTAAVAAAATAPQ